MNVEPALRDVYREWRRLMIASCRAIQRRDWELFGECQQLMQKLRPEASRLTRETRVEWKRSGADLTIKEGEINAILSELMELAHRNQTLLRATRQAAQIERNRLEQAGQNLRLLQQSYAFARPAGWTSFS